MDVNEALEELEVKINRLKVLYDQYFIGLEKTEPAVPRQEIVRLLAVLQREPIRNTASRFRLTTLQQRWSSYCALWIKIQREVEAGTYKPLLLRAQRKGVVLPRELAGKLARAEERRAARSDTDKHAVLSSIPGLTVHELEMLHRRYEDAKGGTAIPYDKFVASLERQVPVLLEKHRCRALSFEVQQRDGKIILKADPKRD